VKAIVSIKAKIKLKKERKKETETKQTTIPSSCWGHALREIVPYLWI